LMNRQAQLEKRFNNILQGRVPADARSYAHFLEVICAQQDPATCIDKIVKSSHGSSAVQAAMRHNTNSQFLNGPATTLLLYLFRATDLGDVLDRLLTAIVDPPIFWSAFSQAFDQGELNEQAQEAFAILLFRLMCLPTRNTSSYHDVAKKSSILARLLGSSQWIVKDNGHRIQYILSTFKSGTPIAAVGGPGGRHDNDFNDFREISILPTADEILCQQPPFIRPSSVLEDPDDEATRIADYLDNTFRMLREDMLYEIKEELQIVTGKKKGRHRGLTIGGVRLGGVYCDTDDGKIRWGIKLECQDDFESMKNLPDKEQRETYLTKDPVGVKILKHQSLMCILSGNKIISLASVHRVVALLADKPPVIVVQLIIACTTTGAAMFAQDIRAASPDVLLVEEAGEILESHILTAMGQSIRQMILIGDHKYYISLNLTPYRQLRPKVKNYKLSVEKGDGFELNRSLFERLVLKGFPHETLTAQHRMRPEISAFDDDSRISDKVDGVLSGSKKNTYEAEMVWKIVRYLAQQGYGTEELVVLTPYLGQLSQLQDVLKGDNDPVLNDLDSHDFIRAVLMPAANKTSKKRIRLATIDNYQGEESDIVIASLTRSNKSNDIGFMNSPERLNVLISRARDGLIMIGNSQTFINARKGKELWGEFFELIKKGDYMYEGFPIKYAEQHPDRTVLIKSASEFDTFCPDGGWTVDAQKYGKILEIGSVVFTHTISSNTTLNCGIHPCPLKCHQISDHSKMPCQHPYSGTCPVNHKLKWKCHQSKPRSCPVCVEEARRARKNRKRELELEQKLKEEDLQRQIQREEEKSKHELQMAKLNAELKAEMDAMADAQVAQQRANSIKQKMKDIKAARANAQAHADAAYSASPSRTRHTFI
ncbi:AAA domain-containing protein, partial [Suillus bovinus]|uniref:AAA domain-containing protein n=1 Tax=Suillus bovinus TaxID=48563 RepID=UPI001B86927C